MSADESAPGSRLRVTSPGRVVWPEAGFTRLALLPARRPRSAPVPVDRPVTLARFPEGVDRYGWYQTQCRGPSWIPGRRVGTQDYCLLNDLPSLLWATNGGAVELHPLLSRGERVEEPTAVVFDLDPYSLRGMHVPTVAAPLTWDEVERVSASHGSHGLVFTPAAVLERIERLGDPFRRRPRARPAAPGRRLERSEDLRPLVTLPRMSAPPYGA